jgi:hypothetical protein
MIDDSGLHDDQWRAVGREIGKILGKAAGEFLLPSSPNVVLEAVQEGLIDVGVKLESQAFIAHALEHIVAIGATARLVDWRAVVGVGGRARGRSGIRNRGLARGPDRTRGHRTREPYRSMSSAQPKSLVPLMGTRRTPTCRSSRRGNRATWASNPTGSRGHTDPCTPPGTGWSPRTNLRAGRAGPWCSSRRRSSWCSSRRRCPGLDRGTCSARTRPRVR